MGIVDEKMKFNRLVLANWFRGCYVNDGGWDTNGRSDFGSWFVLTTWGCLMGFLMVLWCLSICWYFVNRTEVKKTIDVEAVDLDRFTSK